MGSNGRTTPASARGDHTRDRLLDAVEALAAEHGLPALTHRAIARHARLHAALIHYHFGTVERLVAEALARRAQRLSHAQLAGLSALIARGRWTVEDVVAALWHPFTALRGPVDGGWRNYLCLVARLASDPRGAPLISRHLEGAAQFALDALRGALPAASRQTLKEGLRLVQTLFEQESLARCRSETRGEADRDDARLVAFAAAGLRALAGEPSAAPQLARNVAA
jgi:AcrR family transcriptional regulator